MIFRLLHKFERHAERVVHLDARYAIALLLAATLMFAAMGNLSSDRVLWPRLMSHTSGASLSLPVTRSLPRYSRVGFHLAGLRGPRPSG